MTDGARGCSNILESPRRNVAWFNDFPSYLLSYFMLTTEIAIQSSNSRRKCKATSPFQTKFSCSVSCTVTAICAILSGKNRSGQKKAISPRMLFLQMEGREGQRKPPTSAILCSAPDYLQPRPWPSGSAVTPTHFHTSYPVLSIWCGTTTIVSQYEGGQGLECAP